MVELQERVVGICARWGCAVVVEEEGCVALADGHVTISDCDVTLRDGRAALGDDDIPLAEQPVAGLEVGWKRHRLLHARIMQSTTPLTRADSASREK